MRGVKYTYETHTGDGEPRPIETTTLLAGIAVGHYIQLQDENSGFHAANTFHIEKVETLVLHGDHLDTIQQTIMVFCKRVPRDSGK